MSDFSSSAPMPSSGPNPSLELANLGLLDYEPIRIELQCQTDDDAVRAGRPDKQFRRMACLKEEFTKNFLDAMPPGSVFYDVGANVGSYTLIAAARGIPTVAIEPAAMNQHGLFQNLALNGFLPRVVRQQVALGSANRWAWICFPRGSLRSGSASFVICDERDLPHYLPQTDHQEKVQIWRLDDLIAAHALKPPTHLKLDVDGAELEVLRGMEAQLAGSTLRAMMIELQPNLEKEITAYLAKRGWVIGERYPVRGIAYGLAVRAEARFDALAAGGAWKTAA